MIEIDWLVYYIWLIFVLKFHVCMLRLWFDIATASDCCWNQWYVTGVTWTTGSLVCFSGQTSMNLCVLTLAAVQYLWTVRTQGVVSRTCKNWMPFLSFDLKFSKRLPRPCWKKSEFCAVGCCGCLTYGGISSPQDWGKPFHTSLTFPWSHLVCMCMYVLYRDTYYSAF